ncbi:exodeoxyribonuclease-3 [Ancylobacter sp. 3268]|nr:exodeoxyribonuclease III [Ancylobacter sp. 3268]MDR6954746.1 exodeoxyribonuclease-3 [Ancylobacter sp. 3268]
MKIASFNVNGVNGRLQVLLRWLESAQPDVVCLQALKAPDDRFPNREIEKAGYGAIWQGQKSWNGVAILARSHEPIATRRGLPGDPDDGQRRYIEAAVAGMGRCLPLFAERQSRAGTEVRLQAALVRRLTDYAAELLALDVPVVIAGDYNVTPTELDVYKPERWIDDALFRPEVKDAFRVPAGQG